MNLKLLFSVILIVLLINPAFAFTLDSNTTSQYRIFKCQATTITATIGGGYAGSVWVNLTPSNGYPMESYPMVNTAPGEYAYTYGNDPTLNWGNKSISFYLGTGGQVLTSNGNFTFVYSDACTGANIQGYQNVTYRTTGFGNNTRMLFSGEKNLIEFSVMPYTRMFGNWIYLLMLFAFCSVLYLKNQSIMQPLMLAFSGLATLAFSSFIPPQFKSYVLLLLGIATAAVFWKIFKS